MIRLFSKPMNAITQDDVRQLVEERYPEGDDAEFKRALSTRDGADDRWVTSGDGLGDRARNEIMEVVTAFANGHGGHLLLGIEETTDRPARASAISAIPRCVELAEILRLQIRDCVDPQLPVVDVKGIPTTDGDGGIVMIRVPQSRSAPHRVKQNLKCCVRRADRCEAMTMREIQDLVLQRERGLAAVDMLFVERREMFHQRLTGDFADAVGVRVTLIPIGAELYIERVYRNELMYPVSQSHRGTYGSSKIEVGYYYNPSYADSRPILRGVRYKYGDIEFLVLKEIAKNGMIDFCLFSNRAIDKRVILFVDWVLGLSLNAILTAHRFRCLEGARGCEYALELEMKRSFRPIDFVGFEGIRQPISQLCSIEPNPALIPRLSLGDPTEIPKLMETIKNDVFDCARIDAQPHRLDIAIPPELID